jgi:tetratricopeptide (TPR) repeat protein
MSRGDTAQAIRLYKKALDDDPRCFDAWANLGSLYMDAGKADRAEAALVRALELDPNSVAVLANKANLANQLGDTAGAAELYRRVLSLVPDDAEIWHDLARIKRFSEDDSDLAALRKLLEDASLEGERRMFLDFAIGKAFEDIGEYDAAFYHLSRANKFRHDASPFDIASHSRLTDRLIDTFDRPFFTNRMGTGLASEVPVFVLGMPRSGTTLIEQILASHSQVYGAGELNEFGNLTGNRVVPFPEASLDLTGADLTGLGADYVHALRALAPDALRITDKMPRNFHFVGLIAVAVPHARIIHCRRSAMDTCLSCYSLHFPTGQTFSYDLATLGGYYRNYRRLIDHWHRVLPGRILDVDYELLTVNAEREARRMIAYCGLEWEDGCLAFDRTTRQIATASAAQVREPIHTRSVARWRRFETHLGELRSALGPYADDVTAE